MRRREFVGLVGSTAILPFAARAQPANAPVVGFLSSRSPEEAAVHTSAFRRGLAEAGFVEGQNVSIVFRWAEGHYERLPPLATELVSRGMAIGKRASTSGVFSMVRNRANCRYCSRLSSSW